MNLVAVNPFVRRQTPDSPFSHYTGTFEELRDLVEVALRDKDPQGKIRQGYRPGVLLVNVPSKDFRSGIIQIDESSELVAGFEPRKEGEEPRKFLRAKGPKQRAVQVEIVLYHHDVLEEDGDAFSDAEWEIISINASPATYEGVIPMQPDTLIANHFQLSGGTETKLSDSEFVEELYKCVMFWRDKALNGG